ncbi:MAG: hypothetical protein LN364_03310 [Candidatus Thermoplasmatota archaeon]|nr:hypothetical protein [Candidatus Thermoplasmatota archaeon]
MPSVISHGRNKTQIIGTNGEAVGSFGGALNFHNADVHDEIFSRYAHFHVDAVKSTLAIASSANDYQITLDDALGFSVNDYIHVNTSTTETTHPRITAIATNLLSLDRRLDKDHEIGDEITKSIIDLAGTTVAGTMATPHIFEIIPEPTEVLDIYRMLISMTHDSAGDLSRFGNLTALTNGLMVRTKKNDTYSTWSNWKRSADMKTDMYDVSFDDRAGGGGLYSTSARLSFFKTGGLLRIDGATNDRLEILVQDDIRDLDFFGIKVQGHFDNK